MKHRHENKPPKMRKLKKIPPSPRTSRNPFETWVLASFVVWALGIAIFGPPAAGVVIDMSSSARYSIAAGIGVGALVGLAGIFHRDIIYAGFLEFAGLLGVIGPLTVYTVNIIKNAEDWQAGLGAIAIVFLLICCIHRAWDVFRWLLYVYHPSKYEEDKSGEKL